MGPPGNRRAFAWGLMDVQFRTRALERYYQDTGAATRAWGPVIAERYQYIVGLLFEARTLLDVAGIRQLRLHPLHGPRTGQHALTLQGRWRLIVEFQTTRMRILAIIEDVSNHYGD